jgi:hypothetical protein
VGENDFELCIPPFLGFHPIFNVNLVQPYFLPEVDGKLAPAKLNSNYLEKDTVDQILDTKMKGTQQ